MVWSTSSPETKPGVSKKAKDVFFLTNFIILFVVFLPDDSLAFFSFINKLTKALFPVPGFPITKKFKVFFKLNSILSSSILGKTIISSPI